MLSYAYLRHPLRPGRQPAVEAQCRAVEARIRQRGLSVATWLEDGPEVRETPLAERPAGGRLCRQLQPDSHVLVVSTSLLCGSARDLRETLADWHRRRIILHVQDRDGQWIDTAQTVGGVNAGEAMLQVLASEERRRREAVREGILASRLQGRPHGLYPPLGFRWETGKDGRQLVPDPGEIAAMQQIVEWRNSGWTWERIYFELLKRRVKTRDEREWSVTRIRRAYDSIGRAYEAHTKANA